MHSKDIQIGGVYALIELGKTTRAYNAGYRHARPVVVLSSKARGGFVVERVDENTLEPLGTSAFTVDPDQLASPWEVHRKLLRAAEAARLYAARYVEQLRRRAGAVATEWSALGLPPLKSPSPSGMQVVSLETLEAVIVALRTARGEEVPDFDATAREVE
jgi:hypothetical protein